MRFTSTRFYENVLHVEHIESYYRHLVAIHAAPREAWAELAERIQDEICAFKVFQNSRDIRGLELVFTCQPVVRR